MGPHSFKRNAKLVQCVELLQLFLKGFFYYSAPFLFLYIRITVESRETRPN